MFEAAWMCEPIETYKAALINVLNQFEAAWMCEPIETSPEFGPMTRTPCLKRRGCVSRLKLKSRALLP